MNTISPEPVSPAAREASNRTLEAAATPRPSASPVPESRLDTRLQPSAPARLLPTAISTALTTCERPSKRLQSQGLPFFGLNRGPRNHYPRTGEKSEPGRVIDRSQTLVQPATPAWASNTDQAQEPLSRLCLGEPACSGPEGFVLGLLTAAAVLGMGYGLSCSLQLVQNWPLFSTGIATLIR